MGCVCDKDKSVIVADDRRFKLRRQIAEGGFSVVFLADERGGAQYAVKRITCHSKSEIDRANLEADLYRRTADNANIVHLEAVAYDTASTSRAMVYQTDPSDLAEATVVFMVFPFYKKGTLLEELQLRRQTSNYFTEATVLKLFHGICNGVLGLHNLKPIPYCHRDLKPGNVLLTADLTPILMDLGSAAPAHMRIATTADALRLQDDAAEHCTMPYRPPELFGVQAGDVVDERVDVWVGCCCSGLLANQHLGGLPRTLTPARMDVDSAAPAHMCIATTSDALRLQDDAAEHCTMPYRPPKLFGVQAGDVVDKRIDVWVGCCFSSLLENQHLGGLPRTLTPALMDVDSAAPAHMCIATTSDALRLQDDAAEHCTMPYRPPKLFGVQAGDVVNERIDVWVGCCCSSLLENQHLGGLPRTLTPALMDVDSTALALMCIATTSDALRLQDNAAEHCTMPYRPPKLFGVQAGDVVDERIDVWVGCCCSGLLENQHLGGLPRTLTPALMDVDSTAPAHMCIATTSDALRLQDNAAEHCTMPYRPLKLFGVQAGDVVDERIDVWVGCCCSGLLENQHLGGLTRTLTPALMDVDSAAPVHMCIATTSDALRLQDDAAEHCTMPYRPLKLFGVQAGDVVDERIDVWVGCCCSGLLENQHLSGLPRTLTPALMDVDSAAPAHMCIATTSDALRLQDDAAEHCTMPYRPSELFGIQAGDVIDERIDVWVGCCCSSLLENQHLGGLPRTLTPALMDVDSAAPAHMCIATTSDALRLQDDATEHCTMPYRPPKLFGVQAGDVVDERIDVWNTDASADGCGVDSAAPAHMCIATTSDALRLQDDAAEHCTMYYRPSELFGIQAGDVVDERIDVWVGCCCSSLLENQHLGGLPRTLTPVLMDVDSAAQAHMRIATTTDALRLQYDAAEHCTMYYRPSELFGIQAGDVVDERIDVWVGCCCSSLLENQHLGGLPRTLTPVLMDVDSAAQAHMRIATTADALRLQDDAAEHCTMYYRPSELFGIQAGDVVDERIDVWVGCCCSSLLENQHLGGLPRTLTPVLMDVDSAAQAHMRIATTADALRLQDDAAEHCTMPYRPSELFGIQAGDVVDERIDVWVGCCCSSLLENQHLGGLPRTLTPALMDVDSAAQAHMRIATTADALRLQDDAAEHCTMPYRPPELFGVQAGDVVDERIDAWSLGCLLYALCYFRSPFDDAHERGDSLALAVLSAVIAIPDDTPFSSQLHGLIQRMMKTDIQERLYVPEVIVSVEEMIRGVEIV